MSFNFVSTDIAFSRKKTMITILQLQFNNVPIECVQSQKHLGLILDSKLDFHEYISSILSKVNKLTAVLRKLFFPRHFLLTIYK